MFDCFSTCLGLNLISPSVRYRENPQIVAMTNLVTAYQHRDIFEAEKIIRSTYFDDLLFFADHLLEQITNQLSSTTHLSDHTSTTCSAHYAHNT